MAPHSSALAWEIPWTGEPGGPQAAGRGVGQAERPRSLSGGAVTRALASWLGCFWPRLRAALSMGKRRGAVPPAALSFCLRAGHCCASVGAAVSWGCWALARVWDPRGVGSALEEQEDWRGAASCSHLHHAGCWERPGSAVADWGQVFGYVSRWR